MEQGLHMVKCVAGCCTFFNALWKRPLVLLPDILVKGCVSVCVCAHACIVCVCACVCIVCVCVRATLLKVCRAER